MFIENSVRCPHLLIWLATRSLLHSSLFWHMMQNLLLYCGEIDRRHFFRLPRRASIMLMPSCDAQCKRSVVAGTQIFRNVSCKVANYLANALFFTIFQKTLYTSSFECNSIRSLGSPASIPTFPFKIPGGGGEQKTWLRRRSRVSAVNIRYNGKTCWLCPCN